MARKGTDDRQSVRTGRGFGVPDWRQADGYPRPEELSEAGWRWEFLRRRPSYRTDFFETENELDGLNKQERFDLEYNVVIPLDPRLSAKQVEGREPLDEGLASAIGSKHKNMSTEDLFYDTRPDFWYARAERRAVDKLLQAAGHLDLILRADVMRPIAPQLQRFKQVLEEQQRFHYEGELIQLRWHTEKWPTYLRVLDARDEGASYARIAEILRGKATEQKARDVLEQAQRLRDNSCWV